MSNEPKIDHDKRDEWDKWFESLPDGETIQTGYTTLNDGSHCLGMFFKDDGAINYCVRTKYGWLNDEELKAKGL